MALVSHNLVSGRRNIIDVLFHRTADMPAFRQYHHRQGVVACGAPRPIAHGNDAFRCLFVDVVVAGLHLEVEWWVCIDRLESCATFNYPSTRASGSFPRFVPDRADNTIEEYVIIHALPRIPPILPLLASNLSGSLRL
jgi:hypothetical protein